MSRKHAATDSVVGYLYQCRYALLAGIEASKYKPGLEISLERFDDVAFEMDDQPIELIQTKHHSVSGDLTDMSVDLWKTLRIWSENVCQNTNLPFDTHFTILTTGSAPDGSAAAHLRWDRDERSVEIALSKLETAAANSRNRETAIGRAQFLSLSSINRMNLLRSVFVFDNSPNIIDTRQELEELFWLSVQQDHISAFVDNLEGWWFSTVISSLSSQGPSTIPVSAIRSKIDELRESFKLGSLPIDDFTIPTDLEEYAEEDQRTFVDQLRLIGVRNKVISSAIRDYYRASEQRSKWARENLLLDGESARYDQELVDRWDRQFEAKLDRYSPLTDDEEKRLCGRDIYHWANGTQIPFRNRTEIWLSAGSYQILSDMLRVGWHPDFQILLGHDGPDGEA